MILHGISEVDLLALELSEQMKIPLAISKTGSVESLIRELRGIEP